MSYPYGELTDVFKVRQDSGVTDSEIHTMLLFAMFFSSQQMN